ncbi:hypothetical protein [Paraburkholderia sp. BCC1886]|uniref:hypothetical protein n=1 Tax=Paraburkholderia sp. BCC1886 TaxID=2562670 RepID=UPI00118455E7|nr:hypothetical protein [Paraburkholderia sp. BCC1886]
MFASLDLLVNISLMAASAAATGLMFLLLLHALALLRTRLLQYVCVQRQDAPDAISSRAGGQFQ